MALYRLYIDKLNVLKKEFPVVVITWARQVGKITRKNRTDD